MDITYSILSAHALATEVAKAYDVGPPVACHLLRRAMSDSYCLATPTSRFILRIYRASHSATAVAFELDLLSHLAGAGVAVSAAIAARDGRLASSLAAPEGVRQLALFPYPARERFDSTDPTHWRSAGQLLATVHGAADGLISARPRPRLDLAASIDSPLAIIRPLFVERSADAALVETLAAELRLRLDTMASEGLDWGVCHGTFNSKVLHFTPDRRTALDDFEGCAEGWRAWDLAGLPCAGRQTGAIGEHFAEGYTAIRPLAPRDWNAAALFVPIRHLWTLATFASKVDERGIRHVTAGALDRWLETFRDCDLVLERQT